MFTLPLARAWPRFNGSTVTYDNSPSSYTPPTNVQITAIAAIPTGYSAQYRTRTNGGAWSAWTTYPGGTVALLSVTASGSTYDAQYRYIETASGAGSPNLSAIAEWTGL